MLPTTIFLFALSIFSLTLFNPNKSHSIAGHLVISEVQVAGNGVGNADQEFIELYNPTESSIPLANLKLKKKTAAGAESTLVASLSGTVAPRHYFLIANPAYTTISIAPDMVYSASSSSIAIDNTILLYAADSSVIDKVGFGSATDREASAAANPAAGQSIERKALATSTAATMAVGGSDEAKGNGEDSNNNSTDFVIRAVPQPQNSSSTPEPDDITPTPTMTSTPTALPTPTLTMIPQPTLTPTLTPTPTVLPTATPTSTPTPSPTITATPTVMQTPTPTVVPSVTPTVTSVPVPNPATDVFGYFNAVMKIMQNNFKFYFPILKF
jgi:hypothetical protein